jgi:hypothetical protein
MLRTVHRDRGGRPYRWMSGTASGARRRNAQLTATAERHRLAAQPPHLGVRRLPAAVHELTAARTHRIIEALTSVGFSTWCRTSMACTIAVARRAAAKLGQDFQVLRTRPFDVGHHTSGNGAGTSMSPSRCADKSRSVTRLRSCAHDCVGEARYRTAATVTDGP